MSVFKREKRLLLRRKLHIDEWTYLVVVIQTKVAFLSSAAAEIVAQLAGNL